jgi:hypothetical protein
MHHYWYAVNIARDSGVSVVRDENRRQHRRRDPAAQGGRWREAVAGGELVALKVAKTTA